jgi:hypothetical protein
MMIKPESLEAESAAVQARDVHFPQINSLALPPIFHLPLSVLAAPLGRAAAAEKQGAVNALDMDGSRSGFDRVRSRPA